MIAARWGMLLVAALLVLATLGSVPTPAAEFRLIAVAAVAVLAPLFWPGCAATPGRTAWRVVAWSAAAAAAAAVALLLLGPGLRGWARVLAPCAMLMALLVPAHAATAGLESALRRRAPGDAADAADVAHAADAVDATAATAARELAGRSVALAVALLGSLLLWLGPVGELLSARQPGSVDALVAFSPLTHLALASGNDLLRNAWLYQHSNLATLPVDYPQLGGLAWVYGAVCLLLALAAMFFCRPRRARGGVGPTDLYTEKTP